MSKKACEYDDKDPRCKSCIRYRQGCQWNGVSRTGNVKRARVAAPRNIAPVVMKEKVVHLRGQEKEVVEEVPCGESSCFIVIAGLTTE